VKIFHFRNFENIWRLEIHLLEANNQDNLFSLELEGMGYEKYPEA
jgi:hypothetical protein